MRFIRAFEKKEGKNTISIAYLSNVRRRKNENRNEKVCLITKKTKR